MNFYIYEFPKCLLTWESAQCIVGWSSVSSCYPLYRLVNSRIMKWICKRVVISFVSLIKSWLSPFLQKVRLPIGLVANVSNVSSCQCAHPKFLIWRENLSTPLLRLSAPPFLYLHLLNKLLVQILLSSPAFTGRHLQLHLYLICC